MPNHLSNENSPYLLQHAHNPVEWYPWGKEALDRARQEDKPIFLSIGYAACHWCHVMAHESFEDPETAAIMNQYFINIKVDREERPDIDSLYMTATVAMTRSGGWPMSVFLTPDLEPFYAGTYFPPEPRYQMPSFKDILIGVTNAWKENRTEILRSGGEVKEYLQKANQPSSKGQTTPDVSVIKDIADQILADYDWKNGGWGRAPKFPQPMLIEFLIEQHFSPGTDQEEDTTKNNLKLIEHVLTSMARGGMYDVVGGGFARYSTDAIWLVPHFEKMLYDNAQLALVYLHGYLITGNTHYKQICEETLTFIQRELGDSSGGFYSSLDADSEREEGKYYVWDYQEVETLLAGDFPIFHAAFDLEPEGNWEGKIVLQRALEDEALADRFALPVTEVRSSIQRSLAMLFNERVHRVRPATDDKVLVSWNAFALHAFAEAGRYLNRSDFIETAKKNAKFLLNELYQDDRLLRSWRTGVARHNAYLEDYAALVIALLSLYQTDPNLEWYQWALKLSDEMVKHFKDPEGGFFDTRDDHEQLLVRPKDTQDNATPSGNSLAAIALLQVSAFGDRPDWLAVADEMITANISNIRSYPTAHGKWLQALRFALTSTREIAILGNPDDAHRAALIETVWSTYDPHRVVAISKYPPPDIAPALLMDRPLLAGIATAYVCRNFVCKLPVNQIQDLKDQLSGYDI